MVNTSPSSTSLSNSSFIIKSEMTNVKEHCVRDEVHHYHINYVDDLSSHSEIRSTLNFENNLCRLEVSQLNEEIFLDENIQCEFECIFHEFDPEVIISYSKLFQRAYITFSDPILASQVRTAINGKDFHNKPLHISYNSSSCQYLKPPKHERIYMQSPPTTPPVGWVAKREELPEINFDLFLALSKLQPNEPLEILPKQNHCPAIVIHPCSDTSDNDDDLDEIINPIIDELGHKKYATIEAKRRAYILHDAILVPGEQHIRQNAGDADKLLSSDQH